MMVGAIAVISVELGHRITRQQHSCLVIIIEIDDLLRCR